MAARSVASATISFGLVSIPVKLFSTAVSSSGIHFNLLHKSCGGRVKQQYICPKDDNVVVPRDDMVKGYEFTKDQFVTFSDEELKSLEEKSTQSVDITEFVPMDRIPTTYFEKSYYLGPDKGGERAYHLLSEAMKKTGKVAVAKYAARGKQYLVVVLPHEHGLLLQQLYYADEVRPASEVPVGESNVKEAELQLALQLIAQIAKEEFRPESYEDDVKKRIEAAIEQKVSGKEVTVAVAEPKAQIIDLMAALKASLSGAPAPAPAADAPAAESVAARKGPRRAADKAPKADKKKSKTGE